MFVTDCETTSIIRSNRNSKLDAFGWTTEMTGDLHTGAYFEECLAKSQGPEGLYYSIYEVLDRKNVTPVSSEKDKLKDGNLKRNKEATHDVCLCVLAMGLQQS